MSLAEHQTGTVKNGDVELFYRRFAAPGAPPVLAPNSTPILILHGLSYFSYDWIGVGTALAAAGREVVAMDMRGFGDSTWSPSRSYGIGDYAGDCIAVLDHLGWNKVNLMGHSMGGRNATWCAAEHPDRINTLILCDYSPVNAKEGSMRVTKTVAGVPDNFATVDDALAYFGKDTGLAADGPYRLRMAAYLAQTDAGLILKRDIFHRERFQAVLDGKGPAGGPDMWAKLGEVAAPTLVVRGTRSDMFAAENVSKVKDTNAGITLVEVDASHDVAGDAPDALIAEVNNFLGEKS